MKKPWLWLCLSICLTACAADGDRIQVDQYDGSRQCADAGMSVQDMQVQLQGITVYAAAKGQLPGVVFPAVCGGATGRINLYTIDAHQRGAALARGFAVLPVGDGLE